MAPPAKSGGSGLTKKFGPLPAWGWIVVAIVAYYLYQKMSGGGGLVGSSSTASTGVAPPTATESFPGGYSYSGPASGAAAYGQSVLGATSPGQGAVGTSPGSGAGTPGTFQGSGYGPPLGTQMATSASGATYSHIPSPAALSPGVTTYYEPAAGVFMPTTGVPLAPGTPQYYPTGV
jgi:hypothetical protein